MVTRDEWVSAAMTDDMVVVELLVRLKHQPHTSPPAKVTLPPLKWGLRQRRSRTLRCDRKEADSARCSPTTPLSWSGGAASPSATADGFEQSSRFPAPQRSKATVINETTTTAASKRSRRKKTFVELKNEEFFLLKERVHLKKELEMTRATITEQRAKNESLKRMKLDLGLHSKKDSFPTSEESKDTALDQCCRIVAASPSLLRPAAAIEPSALESGQVTKVVSNQDGCFLLPDLNMMPSEEDFLSETRYGIS